MQQLWPPFEALGEQLRRWQEQYPHLVSLETLGASAEGRSIFSATITDPASDGDDKEHVLITGQHSGIERSGSGSIFALMQWLLSGEPGAAETLKRQVVVFMPVVNPDGYVRGTHTTTHGRDPYTYWNLDGPEEPEHMPESVAVQQMMDRYQPEVHADVHGLDESFRGYMSLENSASSYSNSSLRPYHYEIARRMDDAALQAGFPSDLLEQDAERLLWGPELDEISHKLWVGRPRHYAATYAYNKFHSLTLASEAMWELSGLVRHQALLGIGNETWDTEYYAGYPTRIIASNILYQIAAYGQTAAQRRASRVELWNKVGQFRHGPVNPQKDGVMLYACATTREASEKWLGDPRLQTVLPGLAEHPSIDAAPIEALLADHPRGAGQWGPEPEIYLVGGEKAPEQSEPVQNGIALRLRIPYPKGKLLEVRLNGRPLPVSELDGYTTWTARGYQCVQANIPPEKTRAEDLFVVTLRYDPGVERVQGWQPTV